MFPTAPRLWDAQKNEFISLNWHSLGAVPNCLSKYKKTMVNYKIILTIGLLTLLVSSLATAQTAPVKPGYLYPVTTGVPAGKTVYICGMKPFDAQGQLVGAGNLTAQIQQVFQNITTSLGTVGMTRQNIVQINYRLKTNPDKAGGDTDKNTLTQVSTAFFDKVAVSRISETKVIPVVNRSDVLIEIEVIAAK